MNTRRILLGALLIAVLGGFAWLVLRPREPVYQGKTLDAWLDDLAAHWATGFQDGPYCEALHRIGPQAIPRIIRRLEQNDSRFYNAYRARWTKLPGVLQKLLPKPNQIPFPEPVALQGFYLLGPEATRPLMLVLRHPNPTVRQAAITAIVTRWDPASTREAMPLFIDLLKDRDPAVRYFAAFLLGRYGRAASNAVPALTAALGSSEAGHLNNPQALVPSAISALGEIGPSAQSAIPALTNLLASGDPAIRMASAAAIWHISSNDSVALPVLMSDSPKVDPRTRGAGFVALCEMGPRAKAAFPILLDELNNTNANFWELTHITNALKAIDPEAAAKAGVK